MQPPQQSWGWVTIFIAISLIRIRNPLPYRGLTLCHSTYLDPIIVVLASRYRFHCGNTVGNGYLNWPGPPAQQQISMYTKRFLLSGLSSLLLLLHRERWGNLMIRRNEC
ncbi:GD19896 [Drosophila simulans]|uniref:GD19896 n=1 Tax=Drosophila simulans TaxID=7240 RepID=B4QYX6_DROSI|nr:GD19896 [Drosophila simulans]